MTGESRYTARENELLLHAVRDLVARRKLGGRPLPDGFDALHAKLDSFVRETKTCAAQPQSPPSAADELIDTTEAAAILGHSPQWVRRISDRLGGREIGGRWLFPRQSVVDHAQRKADRNQ